MFDDVGPECFALLAKAPTVLVDGLVPMAELWALTHPEMMLHAGEISAAATAYAGVSPGWLLLSVGILFTC